MNLQQRSMITSEEIYQDLCDKIEHLEYMPGESISENELCAVYATSRHMVRGAFAMLRQRQLLEVYPQRGSFVSLIDIDYIEDIIYVREAIEQEAVQRILDADEKVDGLCVQLELLVERQKLCLQEETPNDAYYELDEEFHNLLLETAGKKGIMHMLGDSYIHFRRWRNLELCSTMRVKQLIDQHQGIIRNLRERDRMALRRTMHEHIDAIGLYHSFCETDKNIYFYKK